MTNQVENFRSICLALLKEQGPFNLRSNWVRTRQIAANVSPSSEFFESLSLSHKFVWCLATTEEFSQERNDFLSRILKDFLIKEPDQESLEILKFFSFKDLEKSLLPFIYKEGDTGKVAGYVAAKLKVFLSPDSFFHFLKSRKWTTPELINLALLARSAELQTIDSKLEAARTTISGNMIKELLDEFNYLLSKQSELAPKLPELAKIVVPAAPFETSPKAKASNEPQPKADISKIHEILANIDSRIKNQSIALPQPVVAIFLLSAVLLLLAWSVSFVGNAPGMTKTGYSTQKKLPAFWVDALTQEEVTPAFIAADKDYRMGELYLTRDRYLEAISLFQDALAQVPSHHMARLRLGYCRMKSGESDLAKDEFRRILKSEPQFKLANLYLAQIDVREGQYKIAQSHYAAEFKINKDLEVGLEYAGFLQKLGKTSESEEVLEELGKIYPDRTLVLNTSQISDRKDSK